MNLESIRGSSMIVKMARALVEDGWLFTPNEFDVIIKAEHRDTGEAISFHSIGNLKRWMYEKALSY